MLSWMSSPEQADDADAVTLQPMTGHVEVKDVTLVTRRDKGDLKEYQFICKAWTEDTFVGSTGGAGSTTITTF